MGETYQFQFPKMQLIDESWIIQMRSISEQASASIAKWRLINKPWTSRMHEIMEQASASLAKWQKIADDIRESLEQTSIVARSILIKLEASLKLPEKPVIAPSVPYRNAEPVSHEKIPMSETKVINDTDRKVEYQQQIKEDLNKGILQRWASRYRKRRTVGDEGKDPGMRPPQWLRRPTWGEVMWAIPVALDIINLMSGLPSFNFVCLVLIYGQSGCPRIC